MNDEPATRTSFICWLPRLSLGLQLQADRVEPLGDSVALIDDIVAMKT
jgi:hypothetical protein